MNSFNKYKDYIYKIAQEVNPDDFDNTGKIPTIENAFSKPLEKKVAYMIATSHEYKKPNVKAALTFVKNYKWELTTEKLCNLQGINKPVNQQKVNDMVKNMKKVEPFIVVNQFHGIRPQTPGKKILIDGHHRSKACEAKNIIEVPVYKGVYTGKAEKSIGELKEKTASEANVFFHASPVQGINKMRLSQDTSGNNKGKVLFVAKDPSFASAFGVRWNDGTARLDVLTKTKGVPTQDNYVKTVLRCTDKVNLDAPCSMYKLKGKFEPLRYDNDIEYITHEDTEIISEEQFKSFRDMAKAYGLDLREVSEKHILSKLKGKKSSNFEKKAMEKVASHFKELKKNEVPLTPKERAEIIKKKAIWGPGNLAVWKSVDKSGNITYITHTHRAYNTAPTLKGAIGRFHNFIKSTAAENEDMMEKTAEEIHPYIVAIDFDGTIKKDSDMSIYGELQPGCQDALEFLKRIGCKLILWTCRSGKELNNALEYLSQAGLADYFDAINENVEGMFKTSKKIFATYYVDDRNIGGFVGWQKVKRIILEDFLRQQSPETLNQLMKSVAKEKGDRDAAKLINYVENNKHKLGE